MVFRDAINDLTILFPSYQCKLIRDKNITRKEWYSSTYITTAV